MSENSPAPRRALHLVVKGLPEERLPRSNPSSAPSLIFPSPASSSTTSPPLLKDKTGFAQLIDALAAHYIEKHIDLVLGIEARGFIFGPASPTASTPALSPYASPETPRARCARHLRSRVRLATRSKSTSMPSQKGQRVVLVDDLLATGGTMEATVKLVKDIGG